MRFQILSLFPKLIESYLSEGVVFQASKKGLFTSQILNPRDFATDGHRSVDDRPFGGGDGMVMLAEILEKTLEARAVKSGPVVYLSPQGKPLNEAIVQRLALEPNLTLICGRYGGIDQRALNRFVDEEISIGDYVISGGELAALVLMDAVVRKIPGALGNQQSAVCDSFSNGILEHPLFTRPQVWNFEMVPAVLTSGNHRKIQEWQFFMGQLVTLKKRPELLKLSSSDREKLFEFYKTLSEEDKKACDVENLGERILKHS